MPRQTACLRTRYLDRLDLLFALHGRASCASQRDRSERTPDRPSAGQPEKPTSRRRNAHGSAGALRMCFSRASNARFRKIKREASGRRTACDRALPQPPGERGRRKCASLRAAPLARSSFARTARRPTSEARSASGTTAPEAARSESVMASGLYHVSSITLSILAAPGTRKDAKGASACPSCRIALGTRR